MRIERIDYSFGIETKCTQTSVYTDVSVNKQSTNSFKLNKIRNFKKITKVTME